MLTEWIHDLSLAGNLRIGLFFLSSLSVGVCGWTQFRDKAKFLVRSQVAEKMTVIQKKNKRLEIALWLCPWVLHSNQLWPLIVSHKCPGSPYSVAGSHCSVEGSRDNLKTLLLERMILTRFMSCWWPSGSFLLIVIYAGLHWHGHCLLQSPY